MLILKKKSLGGNFMPKKTVKKNRKAILKRAYDLGFRYEKVYHGCTQCVLAAIQDVFEMNNEDIFRSASALAAGGGICGDGSCGAYTGGVMALGQIYGRTRENFLDKKGTAKKAFDLTKKLHDKFIDEYGSVICRDIQQKIFGRPFYLRDKDESDKFKKMGAYEEKCSAVAGKSAQWVAEILLDEAGP
jgi:C_GCAxxG_C_C family probable redox protein